MARPGAIAHSSPHLCPRASVLSFSSSVAPLRPLGLGFWVVAALGALRRFSCDVTDAGPASHRVRLWQGGPASTYCRFRLLVLQFTGTSIPGVRLPAPPRISQALLASPEAEGRWQWRSLRPLALPSFVARSAPPRCTSDAVTLAFVSLLVPVQRWSIELPATTVGECRRRHSL